MDLEEALMTVDKKRFGARLQALRERAGLERAELVQRCGLPSVRSLQNWEQGRVLPTIPALVRLSWGLRLPIDDLLGLPPLSQRNDR
jgi:transcriptional regulator with XRE-family HTH domain